MALKASSNISGFPKYWNNRATNPYFEVSKEIKNMYHENSNLIFNNVSDAVYVNFYLKGQDIIQLVDTNQKIHIQIKDTLNSVSYYKKDLTGLKY